MEPIALWHAEHANYARLLDLLQAQLDAFDEGNQPNYPLMLDIVTYLRHFPDRLHHVREDVAFARLVRHDPTLRLPLNRLKQEHRVIVAAGDELLERLNEVNSGAVMTRAALEACAAVYLVYYRHHLATEETEILPRAAALLTAKDWAAVAAAAPADTDPLFGKDPEPRYRDLRRRIALESQPA